MSPCSPCITHMPTHAAKLPLVVVTNAEVAHQKPHSLWLSRHRDPPIDTKHQGALQTVSKLSHLLLFIIHISLRLHNKLFSGQNGLCNDISKYEIFIRHS